MDPASLTILKKSIECPICQEPQLNPKHLPCHHSFCKGCLDDMVKFEQDGSAKIVCPMKCIGNCFIKSNETTNSLPSNYSMQSVLDIVKASYDRYVEYNHYVKRKSFTENYTKYELVYSLIYVRASVYYI